VTALRTPWVRVALLAATVVVAAGIAIGVREVNGRETPAYTVPGDGRLVVGFLTNRANARDREVERGVRAWLRRLDETTRGIPYSDGRVAAVELAAEQAGPDETDAAVDRLLARGASAIIGPSDQSQLARVVERLRGRPVLVLSPLPRGRSVRRVPQAFFLPRADPYAFATVFDVLNPRRRRHRPDPRPAAHRGHRDREDAAAHGVGQPAGGGARRGAGGGCDALV
jgi:hypothetical protein